MSNQDIALRIMMETADFEAKGPEKGWRWNKGVVLFPEARCPYCKEVIKSKAVWMLTKDKLIGQGIPVHGRPFKLEAPQHPHVGISGAICFGNAYDSMQALFGALNPTSEYHSTALWLQGSYWGHYCEEMEQPDEGTFTCSGCDDSWDEDDSYTFRDSLYCESCFNERAFYCNNCGESYSLDERCEGPDGRRSCCNECFNELYFKCEGCEKTYSLDDEQGDRKCSDCCVPSCDGCGKELELDGGLCISCRCEECGELWIDTPTSAECDACGRKYCEDHAEGDCVCVVSVNSVVTASPSETNPGGTIA